MINVKPQVYAALVAACPTADVSDAWPRSWEQMPKITYTEDNNAVESWYDDVEQFARLEYRVDIWDVNSTSTLAAAVDAAMASLGFLRTSGRDLDGELYRHKQLRYECIIDTVTEDVFHD